MKIKDILETKNIDKNQIKLALEQVLNLSRPEILLNKERTLTEKELEEYKKIEEQLTKGIPIQYITEKAYFYNEEFYVNKNTLIPRPETETLVQDTHNLIKKLNKEQIKILDIGTGSGIIAITLKKLNENYQITATDISKEALEVAIKNSKEKKAEVTFIHTDLYQNIKEKFDVIISNPPYIEENSEKIEKQVLKNEPHTALFGGKSGLDFYKRIIKDLNNIINEEHIIAFEIGENQGNQVKDMINEQFPKDTVIIKKDYNNHERYVYSVSNEK